MMGNDVAGQEFCCGGIANRSLAPPSKYSRRASLSPVKTTFHTKEAILILLDRKTTTARHCRTRDEGRGNLVDVMKFSLAWRTDASMLSLDDSGMRPFQPNDGNQLVWNVVLEAGRKHRKVQSVEVSKLGMAH